MWYIKHLTCLFCFQSSYTFGVRAKNPVELVGTWRTWQIATVTVITSLTPQLLPPLIQIGFL